MIPRLGFLAVTMVFTLVSCGTAVATADSDSRADDAKASESIIDIAHRGGAAYAPENTLAAIDEADSRGATTAEIDVQRSKDGKLVVFHDTTLKRTTNIESVFPDRASAKVGDLTLKDLKRLDAGSWFDSSYKGERIPTLKEALKRLREHDLHLFLEIKSPDRYPGIESEIAREVSSDPSWLRGSDVSPGDPLVMQSFDWGSMRKSHRELPSVPHALLGTVPTDELDDYAKWVDMVDPNYKDLKASYVDNVHASGMDVMSYTVNKEKDMRAVIDKGVDGIITDYPDVARRIIEEEEGRQALA